MLPFRVVDEGIKSHDETKEKYNLIVISNKRKV